MLVEKLLEAVASNLRSVVTQAIAQGIELLDEVGGSSDGKDLVSIVVHVVSCFLGSAISHWFFTSVFFDPFPSAADGVTGTHGSWVTQGQLDLG